MGLHSIPKYCIHIKSLCLPHLVNKAFILKTHLKEVVLTIYFHHSKGHEELWIWPKNLTQGEV